jgi:hypothetical protein
MTYFLKSGDRYNVSTKQALDLHDTLPVGTYTVGFDQMAGQFFIKSIEDFEIKHKIYGDTPKRTERILNTFLDRPSSTGVMLSGEKGSGKTLLAKSLSIEGAKRGIPSIVINAPWCGEQFNGFMQMIEQPTIILFDEFEKVYDRDEQEQMLTLLDGVYPSKKLFILTCNDRSRVNAHMQNRPGRIFYRLDYAGLDNDFIIEYCKDNLENQEHIDAICRLASVFDKFNFDMLKAMVEDMNRYNEAPHEVMEYLNAKPDVQQGFMYAAELYIDGEQVDIGDDGEWYGNPLNGVGISYEGRSNKKKRPSRNGNGGDLLEDWEVALIAPQPVSVADVEGGYIQFAPEDMESLDPAKGRFTFRNDQGTLHLTRLKSKEPSYSMLY